MRAYQQLPFFGESPVEAQAESHLVKASPEELSYLQVPFREFRPHLIQKRVHLAFGECHDLGADSDGPLVGRGIKRPNEHAPAVRMQGDVGAPDVNFIHQAMAVTTRAG